MLDAKPRPARERLLDAASELTYARGVTATGVDAIAAAAGVSKPTIYRRWASKQELVADAIRQHPHTRAPAPDTGSLRGDLLAAVRQSAEQQIEAAPVTAGLASRLRDSEELARLVREHAVEVVRGRFKLILERAAARGEIPAAAAVTDLFADVAPAVIHMRVLLSVEPVDDDVLTELVDRVLLPIVLSSQSQEAAT